MSERYPRQLVCHPRGAHSATSPLDPTTSKEFSHTSISAPGRSFSPAALHQPSHRYKLPAGRDPQQERALEDDEWAMNVAETDTAEGMTLMKRSKRLSQPLAVVSAKKNLIPVKHAIIKSFS